MPKRSPKHGVLALDIGTSSVRAVVYDMHGGMRSSTLFDLPYKVRTSEPGEVSSDPNALVTLIAQSVDGALRAAAKDKVDILAAGVSCYWHSLMGVDRTGLLMLYPEIRDSAADQVARFGELLTAACRKRPGPIRLMADVRADVETLGSVAEHFVVEQQVGPLFKRFPVVTICAYDVRVFDGVTVLEALKLHSDIFGPQVGYWLN